VTLCVRFHYNHDRRPLVARGSVRQTVSCAQRGDFAAADTAFYRPDIEKPPGHPGMTTQVGRSVGRGPPGRPSCRPAARRGRLAPRHARSNGRSDPGPISDYRRDISLINFPTKIPSPAGRCPVASIMRRRRLAPTPNTRPHIFPIHIGPPFISARWSPRRALSAALYKTNIAWFIRCPGYRDAKRRLASH